MSTSVVLGAQWGDEGKGKIVDMYSSRADVVMRYQGGHNAGHTVWVNNKKYVLHLIPSGIIHKGTMNLVGNGVVVEPCALLKEMQDLAQDGIVFKGRFFISDRAQVIMPFHMDFDKKREERKGDKKIGTTGRGIGPCYADKVGRSGIRMGDLLNLPYMREKLEGHLDELNAQAQYLGLPNINIDNIMAEFAGYAKELAPYIADTVTMVNEAIAKNQKIMLEGAQGTLLDIDFGTYPYVTSSNGSAGGACCGTGISPRLIGTIVGVTKAYCTRVGEGPFPTELLDDMGEQLRKNGHEFGATTGRPRRCGWLDLVALKFSCMINGLSHIALTKLDVLSGIDELKVCVAYKIDGKETTSFPADLAALASAEPVYISLPGWKEDITKAKSVAELPVNAQSYIKFIKDFVNTDYCVVSVGTDRFETIELIDVFA
ncbi:MAG: adenylosuccinate synthase [Deferribacteraceae bacterium]|jgi:adenylosuccinate synthase|nr:adenylosuccinate synthase [Deferribacteraceae bacterium]